MKENTLISRRQFILISSLSIGTLLFPMPSCKNKKSNYLIDEEVDILNGILDVLFPDDGLGPSHKDFNAIQYIINVLNDPFYDGETKIFIIDGIQDINSIAKSLFNKELPRLSYKQKQQVIDHALEKGGKFERWISTIITLVIEALLSDPIYGSNTNEVGWQWLDHYIGIPRPDKETTYQNLYPWQNTTHSNGS